MGPRDGRRRPLRSAKQSGAQYRTVNKCTFFFLFLMTSAVIPASFFALLPLLSSFLLVFSWTPFSLSLLSSLALAPLLWSLSLSLSVNNTAQHTEQPKHASANGGAVACRTPALCKRRTGSQLPPVS